MKFLKIVSLLVGIVLYSSCGTKDYVMSVTSAQFCNVVICYPDGFWGELETLNIKHIENNGEEVEFYPTTIEIGDEVYKCLDFNVPRPNQNGLEWSEDRLSAKGRSTLSFTSVAKKITLTFIFSLSFNENTELFGGSSMIVSAVSYNGNTIERENHTYNNSVLLFDITEIVE